MDFNDPFRQWLNQRFASANPEPPEDTTSNQHSGFFGDLGHAIGNVLEPIGHAAGNVVHGVEATAGFLGDVGKEVAKGVGDTAKSAVHDLEDTIGTFKDMATSYLTTKEANKVIDNVNQRRHDLNQKYQKGEISLDQFNQVNTQLKDILNKNSENLANDNINNRDATKSAAAAFNTALNVGTLGVGGLVEQGSKVLAKTGINVGKDVAENVIEKGAKAAVEAAANRTAGGAGKTIAKNAAEGALLGGGYGAVQPLEQQGSAASPSDVLHGALTGSLFGGVTGGAGSLLDKNVRAGVKEAPGALRDNLIKPAYAHLNEANSALGEGGYVRVPGAGPDAPNVPESRPADALQTQLESAWNSNDLQGAQQIIDKLPEDLKQPMQREQNQRLQTPGSPLDTASNSAELARRQLNGEDIRPLSPGDQQTMQIAQETAAQFKSPEDYINAAAKSALESEKSRVGGQMQPKGEGGYIRTTDHAPWYSQYFASTGRAPSLSATKDLVRESLQSGRGNNGLIQPEESTIFSILQDREHGLQQTIKEGPPPEMSAQYMDNLAGRSQAIEAPADPQARLKLGNSRGRFQEPPLPASPAPSGEQFPANQRGFFGNIQKSETTTPELKSAIEAQPQTYGDITSNRDLVNKAVQDVGDNPQAVHDKIIAGNELNDQDVVSGLHLMGQYQREGKIDEAVRLADSLDTNLREHGRAVQAASIWGRLTPEGALRFASNRFAKAREKISAGRGYGKGVGAEKDVAKQIQDTVEGGTGVTSDDVRAAVREAAGPDTSAPAGLPAKPGEGQLDINGQPFTGPQGSTTGEKIAGNVERMANPVQKARADLLVKEITRKVKQEMMPTTEKAKPRSPIDVMRDVFARNKEAQDAFPEAQRILMDRAKDNPELQKTLQTFFDSELGNPVAGSTVNAAIKEQMQKNETKISDIITRSWNGQRQSIQDIASDLTKEGFDQDSAAAIAKDVTERLNVRTADAKRNALESLAKEVPKRQKQMFVEKVNKLSNMGALDNADYLDLARAKLKLPVLTENTARQVSELSQKLQDLAPGYERDKVTHELYHVINESVPKTAGEKVAEVVSAPKSLMASFDLSATLRQGGVLGSRFPKEAKAAFGKSVKYFKSSESYDRGMSAIRHDPMYETASRAKLALTGVEGGEEAFVSQLPEKIPLAGKGIQASDRAYTGALTELRFNSFKHIAQDLADSGIDINTFSDEQLQSIGKFINTASGRGVGKQGGLFEKMAPALNRTLFSPRLWKSRLDMLNPGYYAKLDPIARKYALQSAGSFAAVAATVLGLASLAGANVETDPRSSDFLKIRVGETRYDILGGFQQNLVFAARELSGQKKSSTTGEVADLTSGKFGSANRLSILTDLIANKQNPVLATGEDILQGHDEAGNKVNPVTAIGSLAIPLNIQDTYSLGRSTNPLQGLLMGTVPGSVGIGVNTYAAPASSPGQYQQYARSLIGQ